MVGWHDFKKDSWLGTAKLHVPGRKEPALTITAIELSDKLLAVERRDVVIELLACANEIASELKDRLGIGNGCLDWRVIAAEADRMLRQHPEFKSIHVQGKQARQMRGRRLLRRC